MADDVLLNKSATVERCLRRIQDEVGDDVRVLRDDLTRQDAVVLNLQRACQASIDLALHLVRARGLGVPQQSRDAFALLVEAGWLDPALAKRMQRMVGFRNVAVHDYRALNLDVVEALIEHHLGDFTAFTEAALRTQGFREPPAG